MNPLAYASNKVQSQTNRVLDSQSGRDLSAPASQRLKNGSGTGKVANRVFEWTSRGAGIMILAALAAVAAFLIIQAWPALSNPNLRIQVIGQGEPSGLLGFTLPQLFGSALGAFLALILAVPASISIALFITHYASPKVGTILGYLVDLLAAVPSVIYGLWAGLWLLPLMVPLNRWLGDHISFIPFFQGGVSPTGRVMFGVAVVIAVMILPIVTAICREVFLQTPASHKEAALALGATHWEMIRLTVFPFSKRGIISAVMLGMGRALGETMAVVMILSVGSSFSLNLLDAGLHSTIAANIALQFPEASGDLAAVLIATGLALFLLTMMVNMVARWIVARGSQDK